MKKLSRRGVFGGVGGVALGTAGLGSGATLAQAQGTPPAAAAGSGWTPPASAQRCPSK